MAVEVAQAEPLVEPWAHVLRPHGVSLPARLYGTPALHRLAPLRVGMALAHARGAVEWLLPARRQEMLERARAVLGDAPAAEIEALARRMLREQAVQTELSWRPWLVRRIAVDGFEHLEKARAGGRGAVLAMFHVGPIPSLIAALPARGVPFRVVVSPPRTAPLPRGYRGWWKREQHRRFEALGGRFVDGPGKAGTMRRLLEHGDVCMLALDLRGPIPVTLLGREVRAAAGPARLARVAGVAVVPGIALRKGKRVVVRLEPPLEPGSEDDTALSRRIVSALEPHIAAHPEQVNPQLARVLARGAVGE